MGYHHFNQEGLAEAVRTSVLPRGAGLLLSTAKAVEELGILTGDFVTPDEEMADEISKVAIKMGCAIVFDEQAEPTGWLCKPPPATPPPSPRNGECGLKSQVIDFRMQGYGFIGAASDTTCGPTPAECANLAP